MVNVTLEQVKLAESGVELSDSVQSMASCSGLEMSLSDIKVPVEREAPKFEDAFVRNEEEYVKIGK